MPSRSIDHAFTATSATGAATDPTYAGALSFMRRRYTKRLAGADAVVWGIPFDAAVSNRPGARFGPQAIRRASAILDNDPQYPFHADLFADTAVIDYGDCLLDYGEHATTPGRIEREAAKILKSGAFLVSLGGDHFVTWPLLKAHAARHGPLALVQFDAHQDTWHDDGRRIDHGSFVGRAVRDGVIDPTRSIQIGIRTHAPEDCGIEIVFGHEVEEMTTADIAARIMQRTAGAARPMSPSTSTASTPPSRRAPARRWPAGRPRPKCSRCSGWLGRARHGRRRRGRGRARLRPRRHHGHRRGDHRHALSWLACAKARTTIAH